MLLFASAWTNNHPDDDPATVAPVDPRRVLEYWLNRLEPLVGSDVHFVCANRVAGRRGGGVALVSHYPVAPSPRCPVESLLRRTARSCRTVPPDSTYPSLTTFCSKRVLVLPISSSSSSCTA